MSLDFSYGGMQLFPSYRKQLLSAFLAWYSRTFTSRRLHAIHWTAGTYDQNFPPIIRPETDYYEGYHRCILGDQIASNWPLTDECVHWYGRNYSSDVPGGSWATSLCAMYGATTNDLGDYPPTPTQLRLLVQSCAADHIDLHVPVSQLMGHWEGADELDLLHQGVDPSAFPYEEYGPTRGHDMGPGDFRWDPWIMVNRDTLEVACVGDPRTNPGPTSRWLPFMDWLRGEVILEIQRQTEPKWRAA